MGCDGRRVSKWREKYEDMNRIHLVQERNQRPVLVNMKRNFILACTEGALFTSYITTGLSSRTTLRGVNYERRAFYTPNLTLVVCSGVIYDS